MPSKEKSYDGLEDQSPGNVNNPNKSCFQVSNKSNRSNETRSEPQRGSDSESESHNPSDSKQFTRHSQETNSQQSSRRTSTVGSKKRSQSHTSSNSGSDSDSLSESSRLAELSQESRVTNSQRSNKSTKSVSSINGQGSSQNSEKNDSDIDLNSHRAEQSQQSKLANSQLSGKSTSSMISKKSSDSDNSDGSYVTKKQNSNVVNEKLTSKKARYLSDSGDQDSTIAKTTLPLDDSDSDSIINTSKRKPMQKQSIRKLLEDDSSSASDSKNATLKISELSSDSSSKSSSSNKRKTTKNLKVKRRVIQRVESDSSDEESLVPKALTKNSSTNFSSDVTTGTKPDWKKSMGAGLLDDSSSDDGRGLVVSSPTPSSGAKTRSLPKQQKKEFSKVTNIPNKTETAVPNWKKSMGAGLVDDSSSEDERGLVPSPVPSSGAECSVSPVEQKKKYQKTKEKSAKIPIKSSLQMKQEAKDVHSHSQRHRRTEHAELPYHVPKQRSLAEFMARRQTIPVGPGMSLKMPSWQLKEHWKQMAEQEKEATLFFKSESDESADETENSLIQVSSILKKELEKKPEAQEKNTEEEKLQEKSNNVMNDLTSTIMEIKAATCADEDNLDSTNIASASAKEIPREVAMDCSLANNSLSAEEKMHVDTEINCLEASNLGPDPLLSAEINKLNDELDPVIKKDKNIHAADKIGKDDDNSSDSDVALRLSDSEEEKERERPKSNMENVGKPPKENKGNEEQKNITFTEITKKKSTGFEICDMSSDSDTEAAGNCKPSSLEKKETFSDKKLAMLRRHGLVDVANIKPRLSGSKNEIIDLDEDAAKKQSGVMDLMQRFIKHSSKKKPKLEKTELELSIVSAEKGADGLENVQKELVTILLGEEEEERDPVPGAKLQRLRQTLQKQMALKRNAEWKRKMEEKRINSEALGDEEMSDCGILDEETEMTDSEEEEEGEEGNDNEEVDNEEAEDEEDEEDIDLPLKEKKRPKSEYFDEEADESDEGDADISDDEDEEDAIDNPKDSDKEEKGKAVDDPIDKLILEDDNLKNSQSKSRFKRLQTFDMFDSDDDLETSIVEKWAAMEKEEATTPTSPIIPPGQNAKSPVDSQFAVSPMIFNRRSAPTQESPIASQRNQAALSKEEDEQCIASTQDYLNEIMKGTTVKPKEPNHSSSLSKFLFKTDVTNTQMEEDELLSLCSGKFHTQVEKPADDELAELCSGHFPTQTQTQSQREIEDEIQGESQLDADRDDFSQDAQDFGLETQIKGGMPSIRNPSQNIPSSDGKETVQPWMDLQIVSSDDEEGNQYKRDESQLKKKTQKKLNFSDEEDDEDELALEDLEDDPEEDIVDGVKSDQEDAGEESAGEVDYDSEENEVQADVEKVRHAAKDFFEAEAELSESEWGSADEDEQDLDKLDYVAADEEHFDQDQMKEQLDKIHMRQILDADKREVRMLQEMLFEDGDLHTEGGGRERKFRWKNVGDDDMNSGLRGDSGDEGAGDEDEAEDEEKWRIMRHERETFLREQKEKAEAAGKEDQGILEDEDSQFLKLGKAALKRIRSVHSQEQIAIERNITLRKTVSDVLLSPDAKRKCNPVVQRGSFLARGESALARIAAITRGTTGKVVLNAKNSRNFVFATISPKEEELEEPVKVAGKRKAPTVTPTLTKKTKVAEDKSKGRRLFDHLN